MDSSRTGKIEKIAARFCSAPELPETGPALVEAAGRPFGALKIFTTEPASLLPRV